MGDGQGWLGKQVYQMRFCLNQETDAMPVHPWPTHGGLPAINNEFIMSNYYYYQTY